MEFLSKFGTVRNSTAALVVFSAWYIAATLTVLIFEKNLELSLELSAVVLVVVMAFISVIFLLSRLLGRTDIVDVAWGLGFIIAAITSFVNNPSKLTIGVNVQTLVTVLIIIWGVRLSYGIMNRLLKKPEDRRYVELRKKWKGNEFIATYVRVFVVQALLIVIISSAVIHINVSEPTDIGLYAIIGVIVWIIGFVFEAVGDWQLKRFLARSSNKGKLMTKGLWKYTRHPNYFGEATMWWGIFLIALSMPNGWLTIVTPVCITYLLLFVSGVPLAEKASEGKPGWKTYKNRTSQFLPRSPSNDKH